MKITLKRFGGPDCCPGIMHVKSKTQEFECFSLEPSILSAKPCIPEGTYKLKKYFSNKFCENVLLLEDVPERSYIEIHVGNFAKDTRGCILPGRCIKIVGKERSVGESRLAFHRIMKAFEEDGEGVIDIGWYLI